MSNEPEHRNDSENPHDHDSETVTGLEPADDGVAPIVTNTGFDGDAATG